MNAAAVRTTLRSATLMTLLCIALTAAWLFLAFVVPPPGMLALIVGVAWAFLGYLHLVLGPAALFLAFRQRRHLANAWIYAYFFVFAAANLTAMGIYNRWDQVATKEWEKISRGQDVEIRRMALAQDTPDLARARQLLREGANVNTVEPQFQATPLLAAARNGHVELVALLLEHGAKVDARDRWGNTALAIAAGGGVPLAQERKDRILHRPMVYSIMNAGADLNARNDQGETPILGACLMGDVEVFERMRARGAQIDARDTKGWSCLMLAVRRGGVALTARLIELGQDLNHAAKDGLRALDVAFADDNGELVALLLAAGADASTLQHRGRSPVQTAIEKGHTSALEALARGGGFTRALGDGGLEVLAAFVKKGEPEHLQTLLDLGADPDARSADGETVLHALARCAHCPREPDSLQVLVAAGADVDLPGLEGRTPLAYAVEKDNEAVAASLIAAGADIHRVNTDGDSLVLVAAYTGKSRVFELLHAAGARVVQRHPDGRYFTRTMADPVKAGLLLDLKIDPDVPDEHGNLAALLAARGGHTETLRVLLAGGANPDAQARNGRTVLEETIRAKRLASVETLIAGGADVNRRPAGKAPPLYVAIDKGQVAIAIALLEAGARTNPMLRRRADSVLFKGNFKGRDADRLDELRLLLAKAPGA